MINILNRYGKGLGTLSRGAEKNGYFDLSIRSEITDEGIVLRNLTFKADSNDVVTKRITETSRFTVKDGMGVFRHFDVLSIKEEHGEFTDLVVEAEDASYRLLRKQKNPIKQSSTLLESYLSALSGTGITIGKVDSPTTTKMVEIEEHHTAMKRIASLNDVFKMEVDFVAEMSGANLKTVKMNIQKKFGQNRGVRLEYPGNILNISKSVSMDNMVNRVYAYGEDKDGNTVDVSSKVWSLSDGDLMSKPAGDKYLEDKESIKKYGIFEETITESTDNMELLLRYAYNKMLGLTEPEVIYTVDAVELKNVDVCDTVRLVNNEFAKKLNETFRVKSLTWNDTTYDVTIEIGKYKRKKPLLSTELKKLMKETKDNVKRDELDTFKDELRDDYSSDFNDFRNEYEEDKADSPIREGVPNAQRYTDVKINRDNLGDELYLGYSNFRYNGPPNSESEVVDLVLDEKSDGKVSIHKEEIPGFGIAEVISYDSNGEINYGREDYVHEDGETYTRTIAIHPAIKLDSIYPQSSYGYSNSYYPFLTPQIPFNVNDNHLISFYVKNIGDGFEPRIYLTNKYYGDSSTTPYRYSRILGKDFKWAGLSKNQEWVKYEMVLSSKDLWAQIGDVFDDDWGSEIDDTYSPLSRDVTDTTYSSNTIQFNDTNLLDGNINTLTEATSRLLRFEIDIVNSDTGVYVTRDLLGEYFLNSDGSAPNGLVQIGGISVKKINQPIDFERKSDLILLTDSEVKVMKKGYADELEGTAGELGYGENSGTDQTAYYMPIRAGIYYTGSSVRFKSNFKPIRERLDPIEYLNGINIWEYYLKSDLQDRKYDSPKIGVISESSPRHIRDGDGIDTYALASINVAATQDLSKKIEELETEKKDLETTIGALSDELNELKLMFLEHIQGGGG